MIHIKLTWIWKKYPWCLFDTRFGSKIISSRSVIFGKSISYCKNETDKDSNNSTNENWKQSKAIERTRSEIYHYRTNLSPL